MNRKVVFFVLLFVFFVGFFSVSYSESIKDCANAKIAYSMKIITFSKMEEICSKAKPSIKQTKTSKKKIQKGYTEANNIDLPENEFEELTGLKVNPIVPIEFYFYGSFGKKGYVLIPSKEKVNSFDTDLDYDEIERNFFIGTVAIYYKKDIVDKKSSDSFTISKYINPKTHELEDLNIYFDINLEKITGGTRVKYKFYLDKDKTKEIYYRLYDPKKDGSIEGSYFIEGYIGLTYGRYKYLPSRKIIYFKESSFFKSLDPSFFKDFSKKAIYYPTENAHVYYYDDFVIYKYYSPYDYDAQYICIYKIGCKFKNFNGLIDEPKFGFKMFFDYEDEGFRVIAFYKDGPKIVAKLKNLFFTEDNKKIFSFSKDNLIYFNFFNKSSNAVFLTENINQNGGNITFNIDFVDGSYKVVCIEKSSTIDCTLPKSKEEIKKERDKKRRKATIIKQNIADTIKYVSPVVIGLLEDDTPSDGDVGKALFLMPEYDDTKDGKTSIRLDTADDYSFYIYYVDYDILKNTVDHGTMPNIVQSNNVKNKKNIRFGETICTFGTEDNFLKIDCNKNISFINVLNSTGTIQKNYLNFNISYKNNTIIYDYENKIRKILFLVKEQNFFGCPSVSGAKYKKISTPEGIWFTLGSYEYDTDYCFYVKSITDK